MRITETEVRDEVEAALAGAIAHLETVYQTVEYNGLLDEKDTDRIRIGLAINDLADIAGRITS